MTQIANKTVVVKLGGSTLGGSSATGAPDTTLADLLRLVADGFRVVIVHGGGNAINNLLRTQGHEPRFHNGLRVTDQAALAAALMVMRGQINSELVAAINQAGHAQGLSAVGMSGLDGRLLEARRETRHGDIGLVGEIVRVNLKILQAVLDNRFLPVIAPFAVVIDEPTSSIFNINADSVASHLAAALQAETCIFLTDVAGVLDHSGQTIPSLTPAAAQQLISQGVISGGMLPKLEAALKALEGCEKVLVIDGRPPQALYRAVVNSEAEGTIFSRS